MVINQRRRGAYIMAANMNDKNQHSSASSTVDKKGNADITPPQVELSNKSAATTAATTVETAVKTLDDSVKSNYAALITRIQTGDLAKPKRSINPSELSVAVQALIKDIREHNSMDIGQPNSSRKEKSLILGWEENATSNGLTIFALAELLKRNEPIDSIDVCCPFFEIDEIIALANALRNNTSVSRFKISNDHRLGDIGCVILANALQHNRKLVSFWLDSGSFAQPPAVFVTASSVYFKSGVSILQANSVGTMSNPVGDLAAYAFAQALSSNQGLSIVRLLHGDITAWGANELYKAFTSNSGRLEVLDLTYNRIGRQFLSQYFSVAVSDTAIHANMPINGSSLRRAFRLMNLDSQGDFDYTTAARYKMVGRSLVVDSAVTATNTNNTAASAATIANVIARCTTATDNKNDTSAPPVILSAEGKNAAAANVSNSVATVTADAKTASMTPSSSATSTTEQTANNQKAGNNNGWGFCAIQ